MTTMFWDGENKKKIGCDIKFLDGPSTNIIDLTSTLLLEPNVAYSYTAPADGTLMFGRRANSDGGSAVKMYVGCYNDTVYKRIEIWGTGSDMLTVCVKVRKGETVSDIRGIATGEAQFARFIYDYGEKELLDIL